MESSSIGHNGAEGPRFQPDANPAVARRRARLAQQADRNRETLRESDRARFWFAVKTAVICVGGCFTGLLPMAWAVHSPDMESAKIAWVLGPVIGNTIILVTLVVAGVKWDRDDW
jgi:hypothetical protein